MGLGASADLRAKYVLLTMHVLSGGTSVPVEQAAKPGFVKGQNCIKSKSVPGEFAECTHTHTSEH